MPSHRLDYEILGSSAQSVEIVLDPGETVIAEAGAMNYMTEGVRFETRMGDGSTRGVLGKLWGAGKRLLTGESLFMTVFQNQGAGKRRVAFGAPYPGKIVPVNLSEIGGELIAQKDAFLCAAKGVSVGIAFQKRIGAGLARGARQRAGLLDAAAHASQQRNPAVDHLRRNMHGAFRLRGLQAVELAGVAVGHEHMDARRNGPVHHRTQRRRSDLVVAVERHDQYARDAVERLAQRVFLKASHSVSELQWK